MKIPLIRLLLVTFLATASLKGAPYVGSAEALGQFNDITVEQMNELRTKKILFASRSFGLNLQDGLRALPSQYNLLNSAVSYDVFGAGGELSVIPGDSFEHYNFVHFLASYWPHSLRIDETERLLREAPWSFASKVDVVMIYFHYARPSMFDYYSEHMDKMQADFPHIKFIYACAGYMDGAIKPAENESSYAFNELLKARYQGVAPVYDLAAILSKDGESGKSFHPDYSNDPAGVHPDAPEGEEAMAKGFLVMLKELFFATEGVTPDAPTNVSVSTLSDSELHISWTASTISEGSIHFYRILREGKLIGTSTGTEYTDTGLNENTPYDYSVLAVSTNGVQSEASAPVNGRTAFDITPPSLLAAPDSGEKTRIVLKFSEDLEVSSGSDPLNYSIPGLTVLSATVLGSEVILETSEMMAETVYTVTASGIRDDATHPNSIADGAQASFQYTPPDVPVPVAHWSFEEAIVDDYGSTASWKDGSASYDDGFIGTGLSFDGSNTAPYVLIGDNPAHDSGSGLTLSVWARKQDADIGGWLLKKHIAFDLFIKNDEINGYIFNESGARADFSVNVPGINDTLWHHYCLTYDGERVVVAVDGQAVTQVAQSGWVANSSQGIYVGKEPWGSALTFAGQIDELTLYDQAADPEALYLAGMDYVAVQSLLEKNSAGRTVDSVAVMNDSGRIIELYIQEGGIREITEDIGQLSELRILHCYGDRELSYDLLTRIDPAIDNCTLLEELLINQNDLAGLPVEIAGLTRLKVFSAGDNYLADLEDPVRSWLTDYDPDWLHTQVNYIPPTPQTWEAYQVEHFTEIELGDVEISGKAADPDLDNLGNFLEYYLQSDPRNPEAHGDISVSLDAGEVVFQMTGLSEEASYQLEWVKASSPHGPWLPATPNGVSITQDFWETETTQYRFNLTPDRSCTFYRFALTQ